MQKIRWPSISLVCCLLFASCSGSLSAATTIVAVGNDGAPLPSVLVIVKSLDGTGEVGRYLTDDDGRVPPVRMGSGLYRIIAICPTELCETTVREIFGSTLGPEFRLQIPGAQTARTRILLLDASGAPFPDVLVTISSLPENREVGRYLSGPDGRIHPVLLSGRRYRIVATCPYGICDTVTREVSGRDSPAEFRVEIPVKTIGLEGELLGLPRATLIIEMNRGDLSGAHVLVRDPEAHHEAWYKVTADGRVEVSLPSDPAVIAVILDHCVTSYEVGSKCSPRQADDSSFAGCLETGSMNIHVPVAVCR